MLGALLCMPPRHTGLSHRRLDSRPGFLSDQMTSPLFWRRAFQNARHQLIPI